ncbi:MAG: sigma-70 family RNA polymerase sigma factor [Candidatus Brocadiae bacterium]|nr:sigma-70 family RNA polymerase sigma factor [Candidatus Brocadiia bacterium]
MSRDHETERRARAPGSRFATTHWSIVVAARGERTTAARQALATLCEAYWYPLYAYVRRRGYAAADAQDLTQAFFAALLEKQYLRTADRERGRLRSFLLTALKRFVSKQWARAHTLKRGGAHSPVPLDPRSGETRYALEPSHDWTPERLYERRWALTLLEQVMARLRRKYADDGKAELFDHLKAFLTGQSGAPSYRQVACDLDTTEGAVKVAVHRLRRRYRELLRSEIAHTVADPQDAEDELRLLLAALRGEEL